MIDVEKLAAQLGYENEEMAIRLEQFQKDTSQWMQQLKQAINTTDLDTIKIYANAIKKAAGELTLEKLYLKAKELEEYEGDIKNYQALYDTLAAMVETISVSEFI